jgi:GNAT superfamily N-acetyltransferase
MPGNFPTPPAIPGLEWRTLRPDDAGALLKLALACSRADQAPISHELEAWIETMIEGQSPAGDTLAAEQSGGELAAAAWVTYDSWMIHELRASLNGLVHPGMRGQGLGEFLLTWMEGAALAHFPGPEDLRQRVLRIQVYHQATSALDLFARRGFELAQADEELRCDLRHPLPQFSLPPGFSLYPWIPERANLFYKVYVGAFQDRPGFPNWLEDVWLQQVGRLLQPLPYAQPPIRKKRRGEKDAFYKWACTPNTAAWGWAAPCSPPS